MSKQSWIRVKGAREHNLKRIDVKIPHNAITVITGVSGSGKSSLAFDTLFREGQRRYIESFSTYARQYMGKFKRPEVDFIQGLSPALSLEQKTAGHNPRSTVGTATELYDYLRLLFARLGAPGPEAAGIKLERRLFSFNTIQGACPACKGLGVQDRLDPDLLVGDPSLSLRNGALILTTKNNYIVYSQVTMDVLDQICRAHGFDVDTPWEDLPAAAKQIVFFGSRKIKIPFGKHPLASRLRWSGITAKPREEGFYKGIIPVMQEILKRKRNPNILRFVRSLPCRECGGSRLRRESLDVRFRGQNIFDLARLSLEELFQYFSAVRFAAKEKALGNPIVSVLQQKTELLLHLGLGYLTLDRASSTLSGGEGQHIKLANQAGTKLRGLLYVLDEPSLGLHPRDQHRLLDMLGRMRDYGNTLIVVEHDRDTIMRADWLLDIGPAAGRNGGERLFMGPVAKLLSPLPEGTTAAQSRTRAFLTGKESLCLPMPRRPVSGRELRIMGAAQYNLKHIDVAFALESLNAVTGVAGAGKSTLVNLILGRALRKHLHRGTDPPGKHTAILGIENVNKVIEIDQSPIGKTPRSNPATYTKVFDRIRHLFAELPESRRNDWTKGRFSFNVKGGRCESCQGAGVRQIGMLFLGQVDIICEECGGRRFNPATLNIRYRNRNIAEILDMPVEEAVKFFSDRPVIHRILAAMDELGLGYIALGQPATTLSGGEAQRVKLAAELARPATGKTLYILDEPTTGLHSADIKMLLSALNRLINKGNTVILIEHDPEIIKTADRIIDLGPDSGPAGGHLVASGTPEEIAAVTASYTGQALKVCLPGTAGTKKTAAVPLPVRQNMPIRFSGITTHNLKNIDVKIPVNRITVVTGVSGSGKSSLVFDTIFAESRDRFTSSLSTYARTFIAKTKKAQFEHCSGLFPSIAVSQAFAAGNPRSTVGTLTGIYDYFRLLFSRFGRYLPGQEIFPARHFSFNHETGACSSCKGLGSLKVCDPEKLITSSGLSLAQGAMSGTKAGKFYGDPDGRYLQILFQTGKEFGLDFSPPWKELSKAAQQWAMFGAGEQIFNVEWKYKRKSRSGTFKFSTPWKGLTALVNEEYERKHADKRGRALDPLMKTVPCPDCRGARLKPEVLEIRLAEYNIFALCSLSIAKLLYIIERMTTEPRQYICGEKIESLFLDLIREIRRRLFYLKDLGLRYLTLDRPTTSLSGGEARRVRLAGQLGAEMRGVAYILDEPTIGLHNRDIHLLLKTLYKLRDLGNTVIIVEHDAEVIKNSDFLIDLGPGAGKAGGNITAQGRLEDIDANDSQTIRYIRRPDTIPIPKARRNLKPGISIAQAAVNNLQGFDLEIPSKGIIAVSGVSGSGKSSLIFDLLAASADSGAAVGCFSIQGFDHFEKIIRIDQSPVGLSPAGSPVTLMGTFASIRSLFADSPSARNFGYSKSRFSYNNKGGRCEACRGMGAILTSMDFLSDVWTPCDECRGKRYNQETLACKINDLSIADVLDMTVSQAMDFFVHTKTVSHPLTVLDNVGLGYLKLGQAANTLSGGEAQRLKLASELSRGTQASNLYLFDEPTTGLHFEDISRLIELFHQMADKGHTLVICEHHPDVLKNADWIIDLGPEGGEEGGRVIAAGKPENICAVKSSFTGQVLKPYLTRKN